jgi:exonuclease SbcC
VQIRELKKHIADDEARIPVLEKEITDLTQELRGREAIDAQVKENTNELVKERQAVTTAFAAAESARATAEEARRNLTAAEDRRVARDKAQTEIVTKKVELADWRLLEQATGPDGIPALELDELGPGIADDANELLLEAYGPRYRTRFATTRIGGTGSKKKQIETFEIWITDSENGDEQEIATLSGGEYIWIKEAIYEAFAKTRKKNIGIQFLNIFLDEADGALDPEARQQYLRMLEVAHRQSGRYQTFLVTHSSEIQQMAQKVIAVAELPAIEAMAGKEAVID